MAPTRSSSISFSMRNTVAELRRLPLMNPHICVISATAKLRYDHVPTSSRALNGFSIQSSVNLAAQPRTGSAGHDPTATCRSWTRNDPDEQQNVALHFNSDHHGALNSNRLCRFHLRHDDLAIHLFSLMLSDVFVSALASPGDDAPPSHRMLGAVTAGACAPPVNRVHECGCAACCD